jgi:hypothetical protein
MTATIKIVEDVKTIMGGSVSEHRDFSRDLGR